MNVGFVGLGHMGGAIALNLVKAGHQVTVWNRTPEKAAPLVTLGARRAESPRQAASGDIVISMLADDRAVEEVVFGEKGILSADAGAIHVSMSTISVELAERLAAAHAETVSPFVSAPVFGRPAIAMAGRLTILAAGAPAALEACAPVFSAIGHRVFQLGETPSAANLVKLCGNFMMMSAVEAMGEAMTLAKSRISPEMLFDVLTEALFPGPVYETYSQILIDAAYKPARFGALLALKDMNLMAAAANQSRVPMPLLGVVRDHLLGAIAQFGDDVDSSAIALVVERNAERAA
ncbi:MAG: NAD(P)-dependent oxidoreductase [Caulobacter sp.]|nr:NAD(P)-dependent oxidoreductase [Caulobacter sp.]